MLGDPRPVVRERRVSLITDNLALQAVVGGLLAEWRYSLVERPDAGTVVLLEDGCSPPPDSMGIIRLGGPSSAVGDGLAWPLVPEDLWRMLEPHFHRPPRSHIRIDPDRPATVIVRGKREETRLVSFSDLGGRFVLSHELVKDEPLALDVELDGRGWRLQGRVIYVIPPGDHAGAGEYVTGMVFHHARIGDRVPLREFIVRSYLARLAERLPAELFRAGLDHLRLAPAVRQSLLTL